MAVDQVCGMQVNPATGATHRDTGTGTVYFCSGGCATTFDADPQHYSAPTAGTAPGESTR
jgi:Cu+-exporting ATPase